MAKAIDDSDRFLKYKNALSEEQIESFFRKGYVMVRSLFSEEEILEIKQDIENAYDEAQVIVGAEVEAIPKDTGEPFRCKYDGLEGNTASIRAVCNKDNTVSITLISWIGGVKPNLITFGRDERITTRVAQLLGCNKADHLINQAHYKKPHDQVAFNWHQDIQNRRSFDPNWQDINGKGSFVQVLTAIDSVRNTNGPLIIVPNSHKCDLKLDRLDITQHEAEIKKKYPELEKQAVPLLQESGDTLFMHPLLLHKSDVNNSDLPRAIFINGFSYPGANKKSYPGCGSANKIALNISENLLHITENFVSEILTAIEN